MTLFSKFLVISRKKFSYFGPQCVCGLNLSSEKRFLPDVVVVSIILTHVHCNFDPPADFN